MTNPPVGPAWTEEDSEAFAELAEVFVPDREEQIEAFCCLLGELSTPRALELCCGDGRLAEALLERLPGASIVALDGSELMLERASGRLRRFGDRAELGRFDLAAADWREPSLYPGGFGAVVTSLTVHHLDGEGKRRLFADLAKLLEPGGWLLIADLIEPRSPAGSRYAAEAWQRQVARRAERLDRPEAVEAFERLEWNLYLHPDPGDQPSPLLDQLHWLETAGFEAVDVFWMKAGHALFGGQRSSSAQVATQP
jgi:tRNA (cmo5U34)-methyltransferase